MLKNYDSSIQAWGTYLRGFPWDAYGTFTFRNATALTLAKALLKRFLELHGPAACFAAVEQRTSGCGLHSIPLHIHLLAAVTSSKQTGWTENLERHWRVLHGDAHVRRYASSRPASFYVAKLANHPAGDFFFWNMDRMTYTGPTDIWGSMNTSEYVPRHVKHLPYARSLALRTSPSM
jgi:hypothetical protein